MAADEATGFYDTTYRHFTDAVNAKVRAAVFGEEIGQNSWLTADEHRAFFGWLGLAEADEVLEVASGSGGPALFMAATVGCSVVGVDLHDDGVTAANALAAERGLVDRARFVRVDARAQLPFDDGSFDAAICIDSINHIFDREVLFAEWRRVLRPGGRVLFTNPITVTGRLRREEMMIRSGSMGEFVFTAPGVDEALLRSAGFRDIRVEDVTLNMAKVAQRWLEARTQFRRELDEIEGADTNEAFREFFTIVGSLAAEGRLSRLAYVATA